ncbi:flagellar basal body-associated FliL family protein [Leptospira sp. WS58.C1]|uniref:flagellar basal body-associated FliL family protein n=1 Tax=Leptospira TaxID=171 RepID=UPI0002BEB58D|nr:MULTISPECIES: flagellar basal body-associated FliL family protein [unclassified Leptospira]EMJ97331.1 flagellar basal body-associated protein FliL [Leptospira sp. B5-022]MCR1793261.1 flagellar basal body-associated FliL family protein [Leptospira sp. id769339]
MERKVKIAIMIIGIPILVGLIALTLLPATYFLGRFITSKEYKQELDQIPKDQSYFRFQEPFLMNTKDSKFIKFKLALAYKDQPALTMELAKRMTQIRTILNIIIVSKTSEEFQSIESQLSVKNEMEATINHLLTEGKITGVIISDMEIK